MKVNTPFSIMAFPMGPICNLACDYCYCYREHGPMSEVRTMQQMVADIPRDIPTIVSYVQNILLHQHWSRAYGVELSDERRREPLLPLEDGCRFPAER